MVNAKRKWLLVCLGLFVPHEEAVRKAVNKMKGYL